MDKAPVAASSNKGVSGRAYTMDYIENHNTDEDVWVVVNREVYD